MCDKLKYYEEFKKKGVQIEKFRDGIFYFLLKKDGKEYKLIFRTSQIEKHIKSRFLDEEDLIKSGLLDYQLLKGYEAIYSPTNRNIECQLIGLNSTEYENLCQHNPEFIAKFNPYGDIINLPSKNLISNAFNMKISIGYCSKEFKTLLKCKHPIYSIKNDIFSLNISDTDINSHEEALDKLTKFGLSALFSISTELHIKLNLLNDQPRSNYRWFVDEDIAMTADAELPNIVNKYDVKPLSYYLNANICNELPFYQFLQYYHSFEYYLPKSGGELKNLEDLFSQCLNKQSIYNYIKNRSKLKSYYFDNNGYKKISKAGIKHSKSISFDTIAKRVYEIRNAIAHSKSGENKIEPNEENFGLIRNDIKLIKFMVEQILIKKRI